jgi:hypothetical protein
MVYEVGDGNCVRGWWGGWGSMFVDDAGVNVLEGTCWGW